MTQAAAEPVRSTRRLPIAAGMLVIFLAAVGSYAALHYARTTFGLVDRNTPAEEARGTAIWVATIVLGVAASTLAGAVAAPRKSLPYFVASFGLAAASVLRFTSYPVDMVLLLWSSLMMIFAGALGTRTRWIQRRGARSIALAVLGWVAGGVCLWASTWIAAFFE